MTREALAGMAVAKGEILGAIERAISLCDKIEGVECRKCAFTILGSTDCGLTHIRNAAHLSEAS
jgi:hypothetical protein